MSYHARDGLFFYRLPNGDVRVKVKDGPIERFNVVLPSDVWASVLASICARGETYETWNEAKNFHTRK